MPTGLQVVQGQATAVANGSKLTVTNSNGAILNWQSFSIGAGSSVRFDQPNAASQVLNRVTGTDPSNILGSLSSNGRVWLLNPNGVLFGQGARVNVAGLVTSTLNLNDGDWTAGRYLFTSSAGAPAAGIVNQGEIRSAAGGQVLLLAGAGGVRNEGLIDTQGGQIMLAAGSSIELLDTATPRFTVKVTAPAGEALNLGSLNAGRIDVQAATVNQQGLVRADSLGVGPGGEIVLQASERVTLADGSVTRATAASGQGGSIDVLGKEAVLLGSASVDASGASGGGAIRIGGDFHGAGTLPTAQRTYVGSGVQLRADATGRGDGGSVVVWSDDNTRFLGSLSARGGAAGGNGGLAEVSGKQFLDFAGTADLRAPLGQRGSLLLDPLNLIVDDSGSIGVEGSASGNDLSTPTLLWSDYPGATSVISAGAVVSQLSSSSVLLEATNNLTVNSAIGTSSSQSLTMHAGNDLTVNAPITSAGNLTLAANYDFSSGGGPAASGTGTLTLNGALSASTVNLSGAGALTLPSITASTTLTATSTQGSITQQAGTAISTGADGSSFTTNAVGESIALTNTGNKFSGHTLSLHTARFGNASVTGDWLALASGTIGGNLTATALNDGSTQAGTISISNSATLIFNSGSTSTASLLADGDVLLLNGAHITSGATVLGLTLSAGTNPGGGSGTTGLINISGSSISTAGGNIVMGGAGSVTTFAGGSLSNAAPGGVSIASSSVNANGSGTASIQIYGATPASLPGVSVSNASTLQGKQLTIAGSSTGGAGVDLEDATLTTTGAMTIQGVGGNFSGSAEGVTISGVSPITASPGVSGSGVLSISGRSTGGSTGLSISPTTGGFVTAGNGMSLSLFGEAASASDTAVLLSGSFSGSSDLTVTASGPTPTMTLNGATLASGGSGNMVLTGASVLSLNNSQLSAPHRVTIQADSLTIDSSSSITSGQPTGDAILIEGNNGTGIGHFVNMAGTPGLQVSGGRWIIWSTDITDAQNFDPETTAYDFTRHGVSGAADWANDVGNGFVSSAQQNAFLSGSAQNKTYDGTRTAQVSGLFVSTALGTATIGAGASVLFDSKDVGYGSLHLNDDSLVTYVDGNNKPIYGVTLQSSMQAQIFAAPLSITLAAADKVYDSTTAAAVSVTGVTGLVNGEQLTITASGDFADKNVGSGKSVEGSASVGNGPNGELASNYSWSVSNPGGLTASITPATLYISGLSALNKVYDRSTAATLSGSAQVTPISGDDVSLVGTPSAAFSDPNVGSGKTVGVTGFSLTGNDSGNYVLGFASPLTASITPLNLTVSGLTAVGKVYDATTVATLAGSASVTPLAGDSVSVQAGYAGAFADKNVGTGKAVSVTGLNLTGADAGNYQLVAPTNLAADITPAPLSVSGLVAQNKVYDATRAATLGGSASLNAFAGDVVSLAGSGSAQFADKNVGTGKAVTVTGLSLAGADAGNYTLLAPTGLSADITPALLQISGLSASGKVYDATLLASLGGTASVSAYAGDAVGLAGTASGAFADKNVGTGKAVSVTGLSLTGADAGNYQLVSPANLTADITPAPLIVSGLSAQNKVYDATLAATLGGSASVSAFAGDAVSLAGSGSAQFTDRNVGTGKTVLVSGLSLAGADAANYQLVLPSSLTADITPATLTYVADPVTKTLNAALPALSGSVSGFLGSDTQANATSGSLSFTTSATAASPLGSYAINGQGLSAQNYQFVQAAGNETALTVTAPATAEPPPLSVQSSVSSIQSVVPVGLTMPTAPTSTNTSAGMVDFTSPPASGSSSTAPAAAAAASFAPVRLSALSMDALAALLAERDAYKQALLAEAAAKLEKNPGLADVQACQSLQDAAAGTCAVTDELKRKAQQQGGGPLIASAPAAPPAPAPTAAPAPTRPAPAAPAAAAVTAPPRPVQSLPARRHVKLAALPQIERKVAVVIGVNAYQDRSIPGLSNAVNDAEAMGRLFENRLGYETIVIPNATKAAVIGTLNRLALAMDPKDSVTIYYAGHGELVEQTGQGYWLLADADAKKPETWLSNADIGRLINQIGASQVALISDSCYSGSLVSDERIRPSGTPPDPAQLLQRKSVVVMSSGGNEPVSDAGKQGHSPFTFSLLNQLDQLQQWQAGGNVFERVRFAVARELPQRPQYGASAAAGHQRGGDYLFERRQLDAGPQ